MTEYRSTMTQRAMEAMQAAQERASVVPFDESRRSLTETRALDIIATILGASTEWDVAFLEYIADTVARTGRAHPGQQPTDVLRGYQRAADVLDVYYDPDDTAGYDDGAWVVADPDGTELARFPTEEEAREATLTGDYPEDADVAFVSEP